MIRMYREDPLGILQRRYAAGELTTAEYEERKARIERDSDPKLREADAVGAELVVVGTHGHTGLARLLLGSVAEKIVRGAACSVLVVRMTDG